MIVKVKQRLYSTFTCDHCGGFIGIEDNTPERKEGIKNFKQDHKDCKHPENPNVKGYLDTLEKL